MKRSTLVAAAFTLCLAVFSTTGCSGGSNGSRSSQTSTSAGAVVDLLSDVKHRGALLIATDANYSPQSFRRPDGTWVGFDIDVGSEIAKRLGVTPRFIDSNFDQVTAGRWNGRWDVTVDSMAITQERSRALWFTQPYYSTPAAFVVFRSSKIRSIADLPGKKIGVGLATTYEKYLEGRLKTALLQPPARVRVAPYETDLLGLRDLALGDGVKLDAVLTALPTARAAIVSGMPLRVIETPVFKDTSAIALDRRSPLDSRQLLWAVDGIIGEMHRDGTLSSLSMKYYGIDLTRRN